MLAARLIFPEELLNWLRREAIICIAVIPFKYFLKIPFDNNCIQFSSSPTKSPSKRGAHPSKSTVTMQHVQAAIEEMFSSPKLLAIQACSLHEQLFLNALVQEFNRTGVEESVFDQVIRQHYTLCDLEGMSRPNVSELLSVCASLCSSRLILSEHGRNDIRQKVRLNIGIDDVSYALKCL